MTIQTAMPWLTLPATPPAPPFRHAISYPSSPSFLRDVSRNPRHKNSSPARSFNRNLSNNNGFPLRACGNDAVEVSHSHARVQTSSPICHVVSSPPSFLHDSSRNPQHKNSSSTRFFNWNLSADNRFPLRACGDDAVGTPQSHVRTHTPLPIRHAVSFPPSFLRDVSRNPQHSNSSSTWFFSRNLSTNNGFSSRACGNDAMRVPHSHVRIYTSSPIRHAVSSPPSFLHDSSRNPQHKNSSSTRFFNWNLSADNGFPLRACGNDGTGVFYGK
ncbi:hypothetical protein C8R27_12733 [Nitrosomonas ureae]|uniref:hypothetical protein n=1 Tax=Nitrosomonas ureae TaxID=44577 RepID=UPI000D9C8B00|nr:hypothetical protein [Nitrosomonas ureae]PXX11670.1 hypothetical protein C8R27_12733 [Nitrosomonas ureae]